MPALPQSRRGLQNAKTPNWMTDLRREVARDAYDKKSNPGGIVDLGSAENLLMLGALQKWTRSHETADDRNNYLKSNDPQQSPELPTAAAQFLNHFLRPRVSLAPSNILAGNGLPALLDTLFFNLADPGDAILVPTPRSLFALTTTTTRHGLHLCTVPCDDITRARFRQHVRPGRPPPELVARLADAAAAQRRLGRPVRAVVLANPEDPLACCYSPGMLRWVVRWCEEEGAHLVVDEGLALSGDRGGGGGENVFNSVLSLELGKMRENVHVLYGMTKDFGLGGCRVGFVATYNQPLYEAMEKWSMLTCVSAFGGITATKLLSDTKYLNAKFLPAYHAALAARRAALLATLRAQPIPHTEPDAAFFLTVDLSGWLRHFDEEGAGRDGERALLAYLVGRRVFLAPGRAFGATVPGLFRLSYGGDEAALALGVQRLVGALGELDGGDGGGSKQEDKSVDGDDDDVRKKCLGWRGLSCFGGI